MSNLISKLEALILNIKLEGVINPYKALDNFKGMLQGAVKYGSFFFQGKTYNIDFEAPKTRRFINAITNIGNRVTQLDNMMALKKNPYVTVEVNLDGQSGELTVSFNKAKNYEYSFKPYERKAEAVLSFKKKDPAYDEYEANKKDRKHPANPKNPAHQEYIANANNKNHPANPKNKNHAAWLKKVAKMKNK